ncbi:hypothetical protein [Streptomyces sp. NPDC003877]
MNTRRVNGAAGVILAALEQDRTPAGIALALESAGLLMTPETAADMASVSADAVRVAEESVEELRREHAESARLRLALREACDQVAELECELGGATARVAELEQQASVVAKFVAKRAEYVTNLRSCSPDNGHDYDRWQGHAAARRQLAQELGLPVAWPADDVEADGITRRIAPTQALREDAAP